MALLEIKDLEVNYGVIKAIKGVSFDVNEGEIIALIGANGAGKTTILHTITGLIQAKKGSIVFDGKELTKTPPHKIVSMGMAHVPEGRRIFQQLSVLENLKLGAYTRKDKSEIASTLKMVYERFPRLEERKNQVAGTLSGGEQQMLDIGRGMMARPKLMMFDEPSLGLAPVIVQQVFEVIKELNKEGLSIMLIEQNAQKALSISDHAYIMQTGRVVMHGTGKELLADENMVSAYLGE